METIQALLVRMHTSSEKSDWKLCTFRHREMTDLFGEPTFKAVGSIVAAEPKELIELYGEWKDDPKYGRQFVVEGSSFIIPTDPREFQGYLSRRVKGIGPVMARKLVQFFGPNLRDILDNNPSRLREAGLQDSKIVEISRVWDEDKHLRPIMMWLEGKGLNGKTWAARIYRVFGINAVQVLNQNPYLLTQVAGIGFNKADEMAQKAGWPETSPQKTEAACVYALEKGMDDGHIYLQRSELIEKVRNLAGVRIKALEDRRRGGDGTLHTQLLDVEPVIEAITRVIERGDIITETEIVDGKQITMDYHPRLHFQETTLAERIGELLDQPARRATETLKLIAEGEKALSITLSDKQQKAVIAALMNPVSIITGGPGVGKTTVTRVILYCMKKLGWTVSMAAPTGRAAKRMSELTLHPASTVHRLLRYEHGKWSHDRNNQIDCDAIILDEWSMGDIDLTYRTMEAIPSGCHIVIIGDVDQLPSVGPGMILNDLIESGCIPVTRLDAIFRQAQGSLIIQNAHRIIHGIYPEFLDKGQECDHYAMYVPSVLNEDGKKVDDVDWLHAQLRRLASKIPEKYGINPKTDMQVMAPMKMGSAGTQSLNDVLQKALNPEGEAFHVEGRIFHVGDRVMQMKNDYDLDVFNGDVGIVEKYDADKEYATVALDSRTVVYPFDKMRNLQLAFCSTVHKLQGSEVAVAIVVLLGQHFTMLQRNLVYTALTRAKKMCLFLTTPRALGMAIKRCQTKKRNSFLEHRVRKTCKPNNPAAVPVSNTLPLLA